MSSDASYAEDDELTAQYVEWTTSALDRLKELDEILINSNGKELGAAREVYELSHNIKGLGTSFGFDLMTDIGSNLCKYLQNLDGKTEVDALAISAHIKSFIVVMENRILGDGSDQGKAVMSRLYDLTS